MNSVSFDYGYPIYFILMAGAAAFVLVLFFVLKNRSKRTKSAAVIFLAAINFILHVFKLYIFPHYTPSAENAYMCTAYTTCALIILTAPFILAFGGKALKDFLFVVGTVAGVFALVFPYSVIYFSSVGNLSPWEIVRYYANHYLIIASCFLPVALGVHKPSYRNLLKLPVIFLLYHITVFANDCILICAGYMGDFDGSTLYEGLLYWNPSRGITLTDTSEAVLGVMQSVINALTPDIFLENIDGEAFMWPMLYYTPALSVGILVLAAAEYLITDFSGIKTDVLFLVGKIRTIFAALKPENKSPRGEDGDKERGEKRTEYLVYTRKNILRPAESKVASYVPRLKAMRETNKTDEPRKPARTIVYIRPQ